MRTKIALAWSSLQSSFWFRPAAMALLATLLAFGMVMLDQSLVWQPTGVHWLLYQGSASGAQALLSTVAGSMIGVAGTVFSITIAVLSFASATFGARLLRNFMRDQGNQTVLGVFVATYLYCLLVLRTLHSEPGAFVPQFSVTVALMLAVLCLAALIYFIHHVAQSIQAGHVVAQLGRDLHHAIDRFFPPNLERTMPDEQGGVARAVEMLAADAGPVFSVGSGYVEALDLDALLHLCTHHDLKVRLAVATGSFIFAGEPLAMASPAASLTPALARQIRRCVVLGAQRTPNQGVDFALFRLVEIALRALSPGINDPFTAMACIDWLAAGLAVLQDRETPSPYLHDREGYLRVVTRPQTFEGLLASAFDQIRRTGRGNLAIGLKLLGAMSGLLAQARDEEQREALLAQGQVTYQGALAQADTDYDSRVLEREWQVFHEADATYQARATAAPRSHPQPQ
jgi:uncharacterized membrane protein